MDLKQQSDERREAIKKLIETIAISDQKQLVELLKKEYNIITNQAVVSRDLRALSVVKKIRNGIHTYELPNVDVSAEILKLALVDITYNESMIVIRTYPALADFVGDYIDMHIDLDILGCLSGENTVFVTPKSTRNIKETYKQVCEKLHFKRRTYS